MQTVQMTLEETLVAEVDEVVHKLGTTRSAFTRAALREALEKIREQELERRHREGYGRHPVEPGEFSDWHDEQAWIDSPKSALSISSPSSTHAEGVNYA